MSATIIGPGRWTEFMAGARAELPIAVGVAPFGLIYGVLALANGLPPAAAQAMSAIVFAGSAQFIGERLIGGGAGWPVIWLTTLVVNLRHVLYSASLFPYIRHLRQPWRWLLAYLLTDEAFAVTVLHYRQSSETAAYRHYFFLGAGLMLWGAWQVSTALGVFLGAQAPASWGLDFTLALTFIGLIAPVVQDRPNLAAVIAAGVTATLTYPWPYKLGLFGAALVGISAGLLVERRAATIAEAS